MDDVTSAVVTTAASINTNATIATSLTTGTQLPGTTTSATTTKSPPLTKKSSNTLSVDRAAFLLLRVKKAFKKKRQQRKEKQAQLASAAAAGAQRCNSRRTPAPLLRSRTLPAIVVPGIPVASLHTDKNPLRYEDCVSGKLGANGQRWSSLLMRHATPQVHNNNYMESGANIGWNTLSLPKDDTNLVYRRKSSGSAPHSNISEQPYSRSQSMQQKQLLQQDQLEQQQQQQQCQQQQQQQQQQYQLQEHMTDALDDLECHADGSLLLRIPAPHVVAARAYRLASNKHVTSKTTLNCGNQVPAGSDTAMTGVYNAHPAALSTYESANSTCTSSSSSSSTGATALTRLAKLLHQSSSSSKVVATPVNAIEPQFATIPLPLAAGFDNIDEAPRRLSWERRKDSSALQRSGSIDSFAEIVWSVSPRPSLDIPRNVAPFSKRPSASSLYSNCSNTSQNAQLNINYGSDLNTGGGGSGGSAASSRRESLLSPSSTRRNKVTRIINALFSAIEHGHLDKARTILESTDIDVNSINSDGLSALDVAVLSNNRSMTRMLLQHGALESSQLTNENIGTKLNNQLKDAESRIHDLSDCLEAPYQPSLSARSSISSIIIGNTSSTVTGCTGNEVDKQIGIWERRVKGLRRMLLGWDQAQPPDGPLSVTVDVTSENTITVQILEPIDGAISTKFKVQWSTRADFGNIVGECESMEWNSFHGNMGTLCYIGNLTQGRRYYVRAACGNVKGWGPYKNSTPSNIIPSSWKDLNNREDRYTGRQRILDNLFTAVRLARPADVSELTLNSSNVQKRNPKKKTTIKQLFSVASKFQKNLRRGIYLASIIYCEDKVLVTSEDCLPVIEIDDSYPSTLHSDYHWLMKVAFTWDNVKSLRTDMERNLTSTVQFRTKLLAAVCQMQSALGLTDLGQLYYKPIRDSHGTVVLTCIQSVKTQKTISILNSRWLPVNKLQKKLFALLEDYNISEMLIASVADQMKYHQASTQRLSPGLYLGYLKMQCSVEQIQVVVPVRTPNVLPHCKIRNNAHITAEEWQALKREPLGHQPNTQRRNSSPRGLSFDLSDSNDAEEPSEVQRLFLRDLTAAAQRLLNYMNVKQEDAGTHRLYDIEVIEHSKDISFLIMCPAVELSCAAPGQAEILLQRDDIISLSIQAFEMIHLRTYQPGIIQKYARLSCILELDTALANHSHRQAFSNSELQLAKERLAKLQELTSSLNAVWKSVRWLMDVIAFARDKNPTRSLVFKEILELAPPSGDTVVENTKETQLLQLPVRDVKFNKSGSGRGSWPGPQVSGSSPLDEEHSRSEQNLGRSAITPTTLTAPSFTSNSQKTGTKETQLLNVADYEGMCSRKNSGDSGDSQYTVHSYYSAMDSGPEIDFNIPASRSDDTLAMAAIDASKQHSALSQRKRTTSNLVCSTTQPPLITVHSSNSVPYLARDLIGSSTSLSLRQSGSTVNDHKIDMVKSKASSSMNLRDGGLYLKTTLSALQTEIKADLGTSTAASSSSSNKTNVVKQNSEDDNVSSSSSLTATETTTNANAGIIQVYTAYNTGLATGTSLKLHVTPKTSAREVINLVVQQLNMAAVLKGSNGPIYTPDMLDNFCLVAVIGARERCLRDDFKPLQLQNPWKKGRLYVRQKHELLAAIDHSNRKSHLI